MMFQSGPARYRASNRGPTVAQPPAPRGKHRRAGLPATCRAGPSMQQAAGGTHPPSIHHGCDRRPRHCRPVAVAQLVQAEGPVGLRHAPHAHRGCSSSAEGQSGTSSESWPIHNKAWSCRLATPSCAGLVWWAAQSRSKCGQRTKRKPSSTPVPPLMANSVFPSSKPSPSPVAFTNASFRLQNFLQAAGAGPGGAGLQARHPVSACLCLPPALHCSTASLRVPAAAAHLN